MNTKQVNDLFFTDVNITTIYFITIVWKITINIYIYRAGLTCSLLQDTVSAQARVMFMAATARPSTSSES